MLGRGVNSLDAKLRRTRLVPAPQRALSYLDGLDSQTLPCTLRDGTVSPTFARVEDYSVLGFNAYTIPSWHMSNLLETDSALSPSAEIVIV